MKKIMFLLATVMLAGALTVNAQGGGGFQRRTVEEQLKAVKEKLAPLNLDKDQTTRSDSTFTDYFKAREKMFDEMRSGGGDRSQMREKFQQLNSERDEKLKKIFTEAQFKKWKDEIEPSLRPQRGQRGGNNQ